jgi:hypothetical protein
VDLRDWLVTLENEGSQSERCACVASVLQPPSQRTGRICFAIGLGADGCWVLSYRCL